MVTKGNITEQLGKVERSGLREYFTGIEVVAEKDVAAYRKVVEKYGLVRQLTWMIGNSPKSDINPALEAGLHGRYSAAPKAQWSKIATRRQFGESWCWTAT